MCCVHFSFEIDSVVQFIHHFNKQPFTWLDAMRFYIDYILFYITGISSCYFFLFVNNLFISLFNGSNYLPAGIRNRSQCK